MLQFDRRRQAARFDEFLEHILLDVIGIGGIAHAAANEIAEFQLLALDGVGDALLLRAAGGRRCGGGACHGRCFSIENIVARYVYILRLPR